MNKTTRPQLSRPEILFVSCFGIGFFPWAPGTWATLVPILPLYCVGKFNPPFIFFIPMFVIATVISCFVTNYVQKKDSVHDPSWIVIDEVLGFTLTWTFFTSANALDLAIMFALFRFFDIVKIWPASFFDKKVAHGYGTIADDLVSGIYAGSLFLMLKHFLHF